MTKETFTSLTLVLERSQTKHCRLRHMPAFVKFYGTSANNYASKHIKYTSQYTLLIFLTSAWNLALSLASSSIVFGTEMSSCTCSAAMLQKQTGRRLQRSNVHEKCEPQVTALESRAQSQVYIAKPHSSHSRHEAKFSQW